jgi:monofunctional biosynthetic peptidoglycan transglycosylase
MRTVVLWLVKISLGWLIVTGLWVLLYALVRPPITTVMVADVIHDLLDGGQWHGIDKRWVPLDTISLAMVRAVIAAEDTRFFEHNGFDWDAIEKARERNERSRGRKLFGASTISMQTAKNVFLRHGRTYIRKALEAYFTVLIEAVWGKRRIMEVYLNVVECAPGVYGVEAAANRDWKKTASQLTESEATLMAAVLPNPRGWRFWNPTAYIKKRQATILACMEQVTLPRDWPVR